MSFILFLSVDPQLVYEACLTGKEKDVPEGILNLFPSSFGDKKHRNIQPELSGGWDKWNFTYVFYCYPRVLDRRIYLTLLSQSLTLKWLELDAKSS